jgi:hypothetical protein
MHLIKYGLNNHSRHRVSRWVGKLIALRLGIRVVVSREQQKFWGFYLSVTYFAFLMPTYLHIVDSTERLKKIKPDYYSGSIKSSNGFFELIEGTRFPTTPADTTGEWRVRPLATDKTAPGFKQ